MQSLIDMLRSNGPFAVISAAFVAIVGYIGREHVKEDRAARLEMDTRLTSLEKTFVRRDDFQRLEDRFEQHARAIRDGQKEVIQMLVSRGHKNG